MEECEVEALGWARGEMPSPILGKGIRRFEQGRPRHRYKLEVVMGEDKITLEASWYRGLIPISATNKTTFVFLRGVLIEFVRIERGIETVHIARRFNGVYDYDNRDECRSDELDADEVDRLLGNAVTNFYRADPRPTLDMMPTMAEGNELDMVRPLLEKFRDDFGCMCIPSGLPPQDWTIQDEGGDVVRLRLYDKDRIDTIGVIHLSRHGRGRLLISYARHHAASIYFMQQETVDFQIDFPGRGFLFLLVDGPKRQVVESPNYIFPTRGWGHEDAAEE